MNFITSKKFPSVAIAFSLLLVAEGFCEAQLPRDSIEVLRSELRTDRKVLVAEQMQFTEQEGQAFWPIYGSYRAEVDRVNDRLVELMLEYADLYPEVPDQRANQMLKELAKIDTNLLSLKRKYIKKLGKVLPASKVFRFAQIDNRQDLAIRMTLAVYVPVLPAGHNEKNNQPR